MNDYNDALNKALRYSMDSVENMLTQLKSPDHNHTRWADGHPTADHTFRGVLADAIEESDRPHRHKEAALLRKEGQHIMVDGEGRVRPAKFTAAHITRAANEYADSLEHYAGFDPLRDVDFDSGDGHYREEDFEEPFEKLTKGQVRVLLLSDDGYHHHINTHHSTLGDLLADHLDHQTNGFFDWDDVPDTEGPYGDEGYSKAGIEREEKELRKAPYEEVDLGHTSERDNGFGFAMHHNEL